MSFTPLSPLALHPTAPLGIFDSGLGGLSVWREILRQHPAESLLYVADSAYCPYGPRPRAEIQARSKAIVDFLLEKGAKMIVVACNTATAAAIQGLRSRYEVPFVGMEPALKPAAQATRSGVVGVLATRGTLAGQHFTQTKERYAQHIRVIGQEGMGLVEVVENDQIHTPETQALLQHYLTPMLAAGADQLVLGCSHYPFLTPVIEALAGNRLHVIDPSPAIGRQVGHLLQQQQRQAPAEAAPTYVCYSTGDLSRLRRMVAAIAPGKAATEVAFEQLDL